MLHKEVTIIEGDVVEFFPNRQIFKKYKQYEKLGAKSKLWGGLYGSKESPRVIGHDFGEEVDVKTAHDKLKQHPKYKELWDIGPAQRVRLGDYFKESAAIELKPDIASDNISGPKLGIMGGNETSSNSHEFKDGHEGEFDNFIELEKIVAQITKGDSNNE